MTWYVVRTNPKCERKAALWLRRAGLRVYVPKRLIARGSKRGEPATCQPLFVGYVLIRFPADLMAGNVPKFAAARACYGVREFLRWLTPYGLAPVPLPDRLVARYMRRQRLGDYDGAKQLKTEREQRRARLRPGATVRIMDGPFASLLGRIERIDGDVARLLVDILGRGTPVSFDHFVDRVEPVAKQRAAA